MKQAYLSQQNCINQRHAEKDNNFINFVRTLYWKFKENGIILYGNLFVHWTSITGSPHIEAHVSGCMWFHCILQHYVQCKW